MKSFWKGYFPFYQHPTLRWVFKTVLSVAVCICLKLPNCKRYLFQIAKYICLNCKTYLSQLQNVFVSIAKCICLKSLNVFVTNCKIYLSPIEKCSCLKVQNVYFFFLVFPYSSFIHSTIRTFSILRIAFLELWIYVKGLCQRQDIFAKIRTFII